jgi:hypothetical protein
MFDRTMNRKVLARNVKFVAHALFRHIYASNKKALSAAVGALTIDEKHIRGKVQLMGSHTRVSPLVAKDSDFITTLQNSFMQHTIDDKITTFALTDFAFYQSSTSPSVSLFATCRLRIRASKLVCFVSALVLPLSSRYSSF